MDSELIYLRELRTGQRGMERPMLGFTRKNRREADDIVTKFGDVISRVPNLKEHSCCLKKG